MQLKQNAVPFMATLCVMRFRFINLENRRPETAMIRKLDFAESYDMLTHRDVVLLDVREEPEFITGHAAGAELLPVDEINAVTAAELFPSHDMPVMVYCRTGRRSERAAQILESLGYGEIYDMGGLVGWPYGLE